MIPSMKITAIETFVVKTEFRPARPWLCCAIRTDEGLSGKGPARQDRGRYTRPWRAAAPARTESLR